jgi:hypothetical protein
MLAGDDRVAFAEPLRRQDVGQLAVGIFDEGDEAGAVRVVLDPLDAGRLVVAAALEVDEAPRKRTVMRPLLLRPPLEILPVVSALTGSPL